MRYVGVCRSRVGGKWNENGNLQVWCGGSETPKSRLYGGGLLKVRLLFYGNVGEFEYVNGCRKLGDSPVLSVFMKVCGFRWLIFRVKIKECLQQKSGGKKGRKNNIHGGFRHSEEIGWL